MTVADKTDNNNHQHQQQQSTTTTTTIMTSIRSKTLLLTAVALGLGNSFHFGFQLSSPNPTVEVFRRFLNDSYQESYGSWLGDMGYRSLWSLILTLQSVGCILGSLMLVPAAERLGRKRALLAASAVTAVGLLMQILAKTFVKFQLLATGRLLVGISSGLTLGLQPMYLSEISPRSSRGMLGGTTAVFLELGFGLGAVLALPDLIGNDDRWLYLYVLELLTLLPFWAVMVAVPESPKFSAANGRTETALDALRFFGHPSPSVSLREIEEEIGAQRQVAPIRELWTKPHLRRGTALGFAVFMTSTFSGILALDYFSTFLLTQVGLSSRVAEYASVAILCQTCIAASFSSTVVDRVGRRPLLLTTIVVMFVCNCLLLTFYLLYTDLGLVWSGYVCVAVAIAFTLTFGLGPSVLQWVVMSEMVPQKARSPAQSVAFTVHRVASIGVTFAFFPLQGASGAYSLLLFIVPLPILFAVFYFYMPETKNRTQIEIMQSLGYQQSADGRGDGDLDDDDGDDRAPENVDIDRVATTRITVNGDNPH